MENSFGYISVRGKLKKVNNVEVNGYDIVTEGKLIRLARIKEEWMQFVGDYKKVICQLEENNFKADLFTFIQRIGDREPKYKLYFEWDNSAAIPISTYENWFEKQTHQMVRRAIKKSVKKGVEVRLVTFSDQFVAGIKKIYDETPIRQGRQFWHYSKDFESVKRENGTFLDSSQFVGAYIGDEMIGFMKIVFSDNTAFPMQILSMNKHRDKSPTNALISKAVQVCAETGIEYFHYGKIQQVGSELDSLSIFKERNGFLKYDFPRYYVPLNLRGKFVLDAGLQHGIRGIMPANVIRILKEMRSKYINYKFRNRHENNEDDN
jgi:Acetyltransferase (GNAT) domain